MQIVFIGAGNLATNLALATIKSGHKVLQVYSKTELSASCLAGKINVPYTTDLSKVVTGADIYFVSVKDDALQEVAKNLFNSVSNVFIVHTAGSMPMDILPGCKRGVFYPMQTFSKEKPVDFNHIPCFIEASDTMHLSLLEQFAESLSDDVVRLTSLQRKYLHLAAVFCCNFSNRCYAIADEILSRNGIDFGCMLPLIDETASKVHAMKPIEAQTGPAVRWDENVMQRHCGFLHEIDKFANTDYETIYKIMSNSIHRSK